MYQVLGDNIDIDVTPQVSGIDFYSFYLGMSRHTLLHQTICTALGDTNSARSTIGIGEQVAVYLDPPLGMTFPETPFWYVLGDATNSPDTGSSTLLTANLSPGSAMVKVVVRDVTLSTSFGIVAPSGISVSFKNDLGLGTPGANQIGASTMYWVYILPTNVSFSQVEMRENISPAVTNTWPNGSKFYTLTTYSWGLGGECSQAIPDTIAELLHPIGKLYDGTNYQSFSYTLNYHNEYFAQNGSWIPFVSVQTTTEYHSDGACREIYQGVPGGWQGPWQ